MHCLQYFRFQLEKIGTGVLLEQGLGMLLGAALNGSSAEGRTPSRGLRRTEGGKLSGPPALAAVAVVVRSPGRRREPPVLESVPASRAISRGLSTWGLLLCLGLQAEPASVPDRLVPFSSGQL